MTPPNVAALRHDREMDTLPPSCPPPTLCSGLEAVVVDLGVLRSDFNRFASNQEMLIRQVRAIAVAVGAELIERKGGR